MGCMERIKKLQKTLLDNSSDGILIDETINLYYLTGLELSAGKLFVTQKNAHLFVDGRYFESAEKNCPLPVALEQPNVVEEFIKKEKLGSLAFDSANTSYNMFLELQKKFPEIKLVPLDNPVKKLRMIKEKEEIQLLKDAAQLGSEGFDFVCSQLKEGLSEQEIASELEIFWKRKGGKKVAFDPIIAFGKNSSMPHYRAGKTTLQKGDIVLIDIGVNFKHYHSDMTRVIFFEGNGSGKLKEIYDVVKTAQQKAVNSCKPGISVGELDAIARDYISSKGFGEYFTHSLGHGVGLEIHEMPTLRNKAPDNQLQLQEGMVITIEPGIYLPDIGGVRIEDTVVITANGHENLTHRAK